MKLNEKILETLITLGRNYETACIHSRLSHKSIERGKLIFEQGNVKRQFLPQNIVVVSQKLMGRLNASELKIAHLIMAQLCKNSALWFFDYRVKKGRQERAILSLRKKKVLIKTNKQGIHLVNPYAIRRGSIVDVLVCTYIACQKGNICSAEDIKDLKMRKSHSFDNWAYMNVDDLDRSWYDNFL